MYTPNHLLIGIAASFFLQASIALKDGENPISNTCEPTLLGVNGFDLCLLGSTGNTLTSLLEIVGDSLFTLQNALKLGKCICNQNCHPSQLVCQDPKVINTTELILGISHNEPLLNAVTQILYNLENYQLYCFCAGKVSPSQACKPVANPEKCEYPKN